VGDKYDNIYVEKLHRAVRRNMREPCLFTVLQDGKQYDIQDPLFRSIPIEHMPGTHPNNLWWYKMQAFRSDVAIDGQNMVLDIDLVIVNSIDKMWDYLSEDFVIIQDFNRHWYPNYHRSNSSVFKFTGRKAAIIWQEWNRSPADFMRKYRGDQDWFDGEMAVMKRWPDSWVMSWKWEVFKGGMISAHSNRYSSDRTILHKDCAILAFHGKPDPHEVDDPVIIHHWN
jgi:hypothetical protein